MALQVELVSPERVLYSGEADMVIARTAGGDIAFLSGHAPFVGVLGNGAVRIQQSDGHQEIAAVHGGFVEVKDNRVIILSDDADLASNIDADKAREDLEAAERDAIETDDAEAQARIVRARTRLDISQM